MHVFYSAVKLHARLCLLGMHDVQSSPTDSGEVLKSIHLPREQGVQEVTLEQLQVFKVHLYTM